MDFELEIDRLVADLPERMSQALEKAEREIAENPPPELKKLRDEVEYLKAVDAVFDGKLKGVHK